MRASRFLYPLLVAALWWAAPCLGQSVTATVAVGDFPHALAVNPVTNKIYVANGTATT